MAGDEGAGTVTGAPEGPTTPTIGPAPAAEPLSVRWANDDPNPIAIVRVVNETEEKVRDMFLRSEKAQTMMREAKRQMMGQEDDERGGDDDEKDDEDWDVIDVPHTLIRKTSSSNNDSKKKNIRLPPPPCEEENLDHYVRAMFTDKQ